MKIAIIVLLGFCAITTQSVNSESFAVERYSELSRSGVLEYLQNTIKALYEQTKLIIKSLIEKLEMIFQKIRDQIVNLILKAKDKLQEIFNAIDEILGDLGENGEAARECVKKYRPIIQDVIEITREDLKECRSNATEELKNIVIEIQQQIDEIQLLAEEIVDIISVCLESSNQPGTVGKCVMLKIFEINGKIGKIVVNIGYALAIIPKKAVEIVTNGKSCYHDVVSTANDKLKVIKDTLIQCANEGGKNLIY